MKRLLPLLLLCLLLSACAARPSPAARAVSLAGRSLPALPEEYDLSFRLEAFQGEERTSYSRVTAVRTADGFSYADSTGTRCLFLRQGADAYAFYIWDSAAGAMVPNEGAVFSGDVLAGFQDSLLHLDLLCQDVSGLEAAGTASVAGRPCRIYRGAGPAGDAFTCRRTYCIDQETGLALSYTISYLQGGRERFTYRLTCDRLVTQGVRLPAAGE